MLNTAHISLLAVLLYYYSTHIVAFDFVMCFHEKNMVTSAADCNRAIQMIPDGSLDWDGKEHAPLNYYLPPSARGYTTPAVFRSGSCVVTMDTNNRKPQPGPMNAASEMYHGFWPEVKKSAERIAKKCFVDGNNGGHEFIEVDLGGSEFRYIIALSAAPVNLAKHGEKWRLGALSFNVYDTAGGSGESSSRAGRA
ncbi:hypothetical protein MMC30_006972 [Trapelia coarctata]|nr:hypothetical protein [Trapelia coarctata]